MNAGATDERTPWSSRIAASCLFVGLALAACDPPASPARESLPFERLAFVAPARVGLSSELEASSESALLVAQFEVTRGEWRAWYLSRSEAADPDAKRRVEAWEPSTFAWPASFLSLDEAREYARALDMRLPSGFEWLRIACGTAAAPYPWGPYDAASVANTLELGLGHPAPVGTFEQGRAPLDIYDLLGNVWEWVDRPPGESGPWQWAMGGSYLTLRQPIFSPRAAPHERVLHLELDAGSRSNDVGVRLVAEAKPWLVAHAAELARAPDAERRLVAVGRRWGPAARPLLEELAAAHKGERAFGWLLAGTRR